MARNPDDRYESAAAFGAALQDAQRIVGIPVTPMVVDANLSALPPHELVTALLQQASMPPRPASTSTLPASSPPVTVQASTVVAGSGALTAPSGSGGEPPKPANPPLPPRDLFFDAGPVLAELVTGPEREPSRGKKRRLLAVVTIVAVIALGSGAVAVALAIGGDDGNQPRANPGTSVPKSSAPTTPSTDAPTTATTATPTTQATAPPATEPTTPPTAPPATPPPVARPTIQVAGPTTIEDNVNYVWRSSSANATAGHWSLTGGVPINLSSTRWAPGTNFGMRAGCSAVGTTYRLTLNVQGPGGTAAATISYNVVDTNGSC
jgi:hypothetical protein